MSSHENGVVHAVIDAVAAHEGVDETDLDPPLDDAIDADALSALYDDHSAPTVRFSYRDHTVVVTGPDAVEVETGPSA
ncbi:HalOD1 output domain-containing protein [Halorarius halobius]|uniref:HalOD1 output domain-containing protein n=1 Tax=Halorarius halobius TaxID=2962671 RepID=UPI0020CEC8D3|nr:HalOD1 output domain-containing protein [Halorarius halobius]